MLSTSASATSTITSSEWSFAAAQLHQEKLGPSSRARALAAITSLLAFGQRTGYLPLNVGAALRLPARKATLAERILSETQIHRLLALEPDHRNRVLLRLLYVAGMRVSELAALKWRDLQARDDAGQVAVFGKGDKTRVVLLPASVWRELERLGRGPADAPVFRSRRGGHLDPSAIYDVVRRPAHRGTGGAGRARLPQFTRGCAGFCRGHQHTLLSSQPRACRLGVGGNARWRRSAE
jgi:integrase